MWQERAHKERVLENNKNVEKEAINSHGNIASTSDNDEILYKNKTWKFVSLPYDRKVIGKR